MLYPVLKCHVGVAHWTKQCWLCTKSKEKMLHTFLLQFQIEATIHTILSKFKQTALLLDKKRKNQIKISECSVKKKMDEIGARLAHSSLDP
jgi:ppGpp synthetase/RelA/SpoT-type nucleotidyltranferase